MNCVGYFSPKHDKRSIQNLWKSSIVDSSFAIHVALNFFKASLFIVSFIHLEPYFSKLYFR